VYASVEVLEVEELIERADDGIAKRGGLFFELLDAERLQPHGNGESVRWLWSLVIRHGNYLQNKRHVPEPDEELELFTQADTAW
jgi:hypothetical protein